MRTVRGDDGTHYLLLEESAPHSRVRNLLTGEQMSVPTADLTVVDPADALEAVGIDAAELDSLRSATQTDRSLSLLLELDASGPLSVRTVLDRFDICESDLHGITTELRAAGFIEPTTVYGERGYRTTEATSEALATRDD